MSNTAIHNPRKVYSQYVDAGAISILSNNVYKVTYYEIITGASGSLTVPAGATINAGEFAGANCILSEIDGANKPTYVTPLDGGGAPVTATLNVGTGAWVKSAATVSVNVALIYSVNIAAINYQNLDNFYILDGVLQIKDITVGTTTITGGTSGRVMYNNAGVVGEYAVTGTGTTAVLSVSPVFGTDITTPIVYGSSASGGNLTIQSTSNATKGTVFFGASASDQKHVFYVGTSTGQIQIRSLVGTLSQTAIYLGVASGSETSSNYAFNWSGSLNINSQGTNSAIDFQHGSQSRMTLYGASTAGASPRWLINFPQQTNITASTETNDFLINTKSQTYLAGNQTILRGLYYKTQNIAFASGSNTVTTYYTVYFESGTASTNCAGITNNYSLGTAGKAKFGGNIELTQTVTTEVLTSDTSVTIVINGVTYKLLAKA